MPSESVSFFAHKEFLYVALLVVLLIVPRILQRWRLPAALASFGFGVLASYYSVRLGGGLDHDPTVELLSTFGIVSLFLFAGLEVELPELRRESRVLVTHLVIRGAMAGATAWAVQRIFAVDIRVALLVALALLTPSTGFILDSLGRLGLSERAAFWVRSKAISSELLALVALFFCVQSTTLDRFALSLLALVLVLLALPWLFAAFARWVLPHAPRSEFAFLILAAVVAALITRGLGMYYLVGAFVVGVVAQRIRRTIPTLVTEHTLHAVEAFSSIFVPFYFFHAGQQIQSSDLSPKALLIGLLFLVTVIPLRIGANLLHRRQAFGESPRESLRVAIPLLPTLVFTLVIAGILRRDFGIEPALFGGLMIYTVINTLVPGMVFGVPTPDTQDLPAELVEDRPAEESHRT